MSITGKIQKDIVAAMKEGDKERVVALRMIVSRLQLCEKEAKEGFAEADEVAVLAAEKKKRLQAAEAFREGGRDESADKEETEAELIDSYLPAGLTGEELAAIVDEEIEAGGSTDIKDMGKVMSRVMPRVAGQADGKAVSDMVKSRLTAD